MKSVRIFAERLLSDYLERLRRGMKAHIGSESPTYLMTVDDAAYLEHIVSLFSVEPLEIHFEDLVVSPREELIRAEYFPSNFVVSRGEAYKKQVITYHIPYSGTEELLSCRPSSSVLDTQRVYLQENCICFEVIDFYGDATRVKSEADRAIELIRTQAGNVASEVGQYNKNLRADALGWIEERRNQVTAQQKVVESLGIPIRKASTIPKTFAIPAIRKKVVSRPTEKAKPDKSEPTLAEEVYEEILQTIHDMGRVFERLPSTYAGKDEETLRDHLILQLEPRFEGSTTGETFNKSGKTDILIRHEKSNVFVAECKFWAGKVKHLETISQLLSYLTWRDSKAAIIYFVNRREIAPVLAEVRETTAEHPCFVRTLEQREESWQMFEFHLPEDPGRALKLAVLSFHIPGP